MRCASAMLPAVAGLALAAPALAQFSLFYNPADINTFPVNPGVSVTDGGTQNGVSFNPAEPNGGSFPSAPVNSLVRVGVGGGWWNGVEYTFQDANINFGVNPNNGFNATLAGFTDFVLEKPTGQGGAISQTGFWGADSANSNGQGTNDAAVFTFNRPMNHFGMFAYDIESATNGRQAAFLRAYQGDTLVFNGQIVWQNDSNGNGLRDGNDDTNYIGVVANQFGAWFDRVAIIVGDDNLAGDGTGTSERWAADFYTFGTAHIPAPSAGALLALGLATGLRRRR